MFCRDLSKNILVVFILQNILPCDLKYFKVVNICNVNLATIIYLNNPGSLPFT